MAAPKLKTSELAKLYPEKQDQNLRDKQLIEMLKKRLNEKFLSDPSACKKAALILESWLHPKK